MKRLSVIGAGHLGRSMARLWHEAGVFRIGDLYSRRAEAAAQAVAFVGAGRPVDQLSALTGADLFLIATPDDALHSAAALLAASGLLRAGDLVFHASGAAPSTVLAPVAECGAHAASLHPVASFADPAQAVANFTGTWVAVEGDERALLILRPAFERIGARLFNVDAEAKPVYHSAAVLACNYLPALMECALRAYAEAGVDRVTALSVLEPIVRGTVDNVFRLGPAQALSGPIARGDYALVERQRRALAARDPLLGRIYRDLGRVALDLSREQGKADAAALAALARELGAETSR